MKPTSLLLFFTIVVLILLFQSFPHESLHQDSVEIEEVLAEDDIETTVFCHLILRRSDKLCFDLTASCVMHNQVFHLSSIFLEVDTPPPEFLSFVL